MKLKKHAQLTGSSIPATVTANPNQGSTTITTDTMVTPAPMQRPYPMQFPSFSHPYSSPVGVAFSMPHRPKTAGVSPIQFLSHPSAWSPYTPSTPTAPPPMPYYPNGLNGASFMSPAAFVPAMTTTPVPYQFFAPTTPTMSNTAALPIMELTPPPSVTIASAQGSHFTYSY